MTKPRDASDGEQANRAVVPGRCVRVSAQTARVAVPGQAHACDPVVELVRDGDIVQAIDITCPCGRHIRLRCLYDEQTVSES
jgi:hypothetical protein